MLKVTQKRAREWGEEQMNITPTPCSPRRILTLHHNSNNNNNNSNNVNNNNAVNVNSSFTSPSSTFNTFSPKKMKDATSNEFGSVPAIQQRSPIRADSPFVAGTNIVTPTDQEMAEVLSRAHKSKKTTSQAPEEMLFTYDQVREIVSRVVAEKEQQLRAEYDQILQQQLQEQYRNFAKFNEDYISRQLKQSDFSYLS